MKTVVLCGLTLLAVAPAFAQSGATASADPPEKTVTLTGCVAGTSSKPIMLTNALVIPGTPQPGQLDQTPSPLPPTMSATGTEPSDPTLPPPTAAPVPAVAPSPTGTSGTKASAMPVGTTGVVTGTAPAGSSGSSLSGYRLSGADMQPWIGKRVQLIGTFVPAAKATPAQPPVLEFRVQTVQPASGPCPKE